MAANFSVSYIYRVVDKYTGPLRGIGKTTNTVRRNFDKIGNSVGQFSQKLASIQSGMAGFAGVLGGKKALDQYVDFETAQNKLASVALTTEENLRKFRDTSKSLGLVTKFTAGEITEGMTQLKLGGLDVNEVLGAIPHTLNLTAASGLEMAEAARISVTTMKQMGMAVGDLADVNDVLITAQSKSSLTVTELAEALKPAGAMARAMGLSFEEIVASLGKIADAGMRGSIGGTQFASGLLMIKTQNPKKIARALRMLNLRMSDIYAETGKFKPGGFTKFLGEMEKFKKAGGDVSKLLYRLFGKVGLKSWLPLVGQGSEAWKKFKRELDSAGGAAKKATELQMRGLPGMIFALISALEGFNIAIMESGIADIIKTFGKMFTSVTRWLAGLNPQLLKFAGFSTILAIGLTSIIVVLGIVGGAVAGIAALFGAASGTIGIVVAVLFAVGAAFAAIVAWRKPIFKFFKTIWTYIKNFFVGIWNYVKKSKIYGIFEFLTGKKKFKDVISGFFGKEPVVSEIEKTIKTTPAAIEAKRTEKMNVSGNIVVSAAPGTKVEEANLETDIPGDLGLNLASLAGAF